MRRGSKTSSVKMEIPQIIGKMDYYIPFAGTLRLLAFHAGVASLPNFLAIGLVSYGIFLFVRDLLPGRRKAKKETTAARN